MVLNPLRHQAMFDPDAYQLETNVIGVGGVGSEVVRLLTKLGVGQNSLLRAWDRDHVESHNVGNQAYDPMDIGQSKVRSLKRHVRIWSGASTGLSTRRQQVVRKVALEGVVFLCLDTMTARKNICRRSLFNNPNVSLCIETRMDAHSAQAYVFDPNNQNHVKMWLAYWYPDTNTENTAGCGGHLSVITAVNATAVLAVQSLIDWFSVKDATRIPNYLSLDLSTWTLRTESWN